MGSQQVLPVDLGVIAEKEGLYFPQISRTEASPANAIYYHT